MRRSALIGILAGLVVIWLVAVVYIAGAGGPAAAPQQQAQTATTRQPVNSGVASVTGAAGPTRFSLAAINTLAAAYPLSVLNGSTEKKIYVIQGKDVDANGDATSWMYGVRHAAGASFLIFDEYGWHEIPAADTFPAQEIDTGALANLTSVFRDNQDLLGSPSITGRQVDVTNATYSVSVQEGPARHVYQFDAGTGALIPTHEE